MRKTNKTKQDAKNNSCVVSSFDTDKIKTNRKIALMFCNDIFVFFKEKSISSRFNIDHNIEKDLYRQNE